MGLTVKTLVALALLLGFAGALPAVSPTLPQLCSSALNPLCCSCINFCRAEEAFCRQKPGFHVGCSLDRLACLNNCEQAIPACAAWDL